MRVAAEGPAAGNQSIDQKATSARLSNWEMLEDGPLHSATADQTAGQQLREPLLLVDNCSLQDAIKKWNGPHGVVMQDVETSLASGSIVSPPLLPLMAVCQSKGAPGAKGPLDATSPAAAARLAARAALRAATTAQHALQATLGIGLTLLALQVPLLIFASRLGNLRPALAVVALALGGVLLRGLQLLQEQRCAERQAALCIVMGSCGPKGGARPHQYRGNLSLVLLGMWAAPLFWLGYLLTFLAFIGYGLVFAAMQPVLDHVK